MEEVSRLLVVKNAEDGKGIFASEDIPAGTLLLQIKGELISFEETKTLGDRESYCLQIDKDKYILPQYPFFLFNHSCNPNCGIKDGQNLCTIAPVLKGYELRWDYSTSMLEKSWTLECDCGEINCRKRITDFDQLPQQLQQTYINQGIVMPFILRQLSYE
jgi:uncharacterized protein